MKKEKKKEGQMGVLLNKTKGTRHDLMRRSVRWTSLPKPNLNGSFPVSRPSSFFCQVYFRTRTKADTIHRERDRECERENQRKEKKKPSAGRGWSIFSLLCVHCGVTQPRWVVKKMKDVM